MPALKFARGVVTSLGAVDAGTTHDLDLPPAEIADYLRRGIAVPAGDAPDATEKPGKKSDRSVGLTTTGAAALIER